MVRVFVEMPTGEERTHEYPEANAVKSDTFFLAVCVEKDQQIVKTLAGFSVRTIQRWELS